MQLQSFIYCKNVKSTTKVIQMTMRCSRSPLWRNTVGLCEVQSRIYVINRWKYYPDYFPDPLALSELVSWRRAHAHIFQTHTSPETRHVAICDECRREPMSVRLFCRKTCRLKRQHLNSEGARRQSARALPFTVTGLAARDGDEDRRIKAWIWVCSSQSYGFWRSGLQRMNKIVSFRNYVAVLVFFIVLLSVTACPRKNAFCGPWQTK